MKLRMLRESDVPRLKELHEKSGLPSDIEFPDLGEFLPMPVIVDENDEIVVAVGSIPTVEVWLFMDHEWETPGMRDEAFKIIHEWLRKDLLARGIVQAHAFPPPALEKTLGRRLIRRFGWIKSSWPCFSRRTDYV